MGRTYKDTHPWITFQLDLNDLDHVSWMLLGEAISKCEHISGVPLQPAVARKLNLVYLTKGVHATTQIEGNTLSEEEVHRRIERDLDLPPSQQYLGQEVDNIVEGYNLIIKDVVEGRPLALTPERIKQFNAIVLKDLPPEEGVVPGEVRKDSVLVGSIYRGAPWDECDDLLDQLCGWLNGLSEIEDPLRKPVALISAILAHLYLAWIHPFGNGNGRTARLMEFQLLLAAGAPTVAAHVLSDHYNRTRTEYYRQLAMTSRKPYDITGFIRYGLQGFVDGLREQIEAIRGQQMMVTWQNFVHAQFDGAETPACLRQRRLVLDLPWGVMTPTSEIPDLTPRLARDYADKGARTVPRDVNALVNRRLVIKAKNGRAVMPYTDQLRAFLPVRVDD
ncbi:Fic family protein [Streptomyces scabiei]|uniref:Fic family protein n=1 Tax=Streptomyces scabiei TaxID=1930 RepID=UPI0029BA5BD9|nr:Fic family protein [Streptomyces scabiei]MDX3162452.1 Fic family protein [Streptomyces scabiei]